MPPVLCDICFLCLHYVDISFAFTEFAYIFYGYFMMETMNWCKKNQPTKKHIYEKMHCPTVTENFQALFIPKTYADFYQRKF